MKKESESNVTADVALPDVPAADVQRRKKMAEEMKTKVTMEAQKIMSKSKLTPETLKKNDVIVTCDQVVAA